MSTSLSFPMPPSYAFETSQKESQPAVSSYVHCIPISPTLPMAVGDVAAAAPAATAAVLCGTTGAAAGGCTTGKSEN